MVQERIVVEVGIAVVGGLGDVIAAAVGIDVAESAVNGPSHFLPGRCIALAAWSMRVGRVEQELRRHWNVSRKEWRSDVQRPYWRWELPGYWADLLMKGPSFLPLCASSLENQG